MSNPAGSPIETPAGVPAAEPAARTRRLRVEELALGILEAGIPARRIEEGGESLRSARMVVGFALVLLLFGVETAAFGHLALPDEATVWLDAAWLASLATLAGVPWALGLRRQPELAANLVVLSTFTLIVAIIALLGGIRSPLLHWCSLFPLLALLMGARRSAWAWAAVAVGTLLAFALLDAEGVGLPDPLRTLGLAGDKLWVHRLVDLCSWMTILLAVALVYERHNERQAAELGTTNSELTREIAQRRHVEQRNLYLAYHDELTELPNRQLFKERLESAISQAGRDGRLVAVMFLDLDGFKEVNDTYGHRLGDVLLQQVAERLGSCVRNADSIFRCTAEGKQQDAGMVSRLGGDEFTILLVRLRSDQEAGIVARRILSALEAPFPLEGHQVYISASIGISLHPRDEGDLSALLRNADLAMYAAKARGKSNYQFFSESMNAEIQQRTTRAAELRRAEERGEFVLHYQPIVQARTHGIVALEVLLRWQHPSRGLLPPGEFIEIAEETRLIVPIAEQTLWRACQQAVRWQEVGLAPLRISVNVSGVELRSGGLSARVAQVLHETGLDPKYLELEITENAVMGDEAEAAAALAELKEIGVHVALDDFGTGYSSLSYVQRLPVDSLKVDRSFVRDVVSSPEAQAITTAIVAMAHGLELKVVAEGVENEAQELFLQGLGCDYLQGFRFSVPRPAHEIQGLLEAGSLPGQPVERARLPGWSPRS